MDQVSDNEQQLENRSAEEIEQAYTFKAIPTIRYYQKTYANSMSNNDKKAVAIFKEYESMEKIKRIKTELTAVSQGKVSPKLLEAQAGPARRGRYGSFEQWAKVVLALLHQGR